MYIETARLELRPLQLSDFASVAALQQNPNVMKFLADGVKSDREVEEFFIKLAAHHAAHGFSWNGLFEKESGCFVGLAGLAYMHFDKINEAIELAYVLDEPFWKKGYATEIAAACVSWGITVLQQDKIFACTRLGNSASQHVLKKVGFSYVDERNYLDKRVHYYEILKNSRFISAFSNK